MKRHLLTSAGLGLLALAAPAMAAGSQPFKVTVEAPGVQATTQSGSHLVYDFNDLVGGADTSGKGTPDLAPFTTDFGSNGLIKATFTGFQLGTSGSYGGNGYLYGGAFGSSQYGVSRGDAVIKFSSPVSYLGFWASALDGDNIVTFYRNGQNISGGINLSNGFVSGPDYQAFVLGGGYLGNPNTPAGEPRWDAHENFAFINFYDAVGFDEVRMTYAAGGGFEFDNVTVAAPVPEPSEWALMAAGLGVVGWVANRRRRRGSPAA